MAADEGGWNPVEEGCQRCHDLSLGTAHVGDDAPRFKAVTAGFNDVADGVDRQTHHDQLGAADGIGRSFADGIHGTRGQGFLAVGFAARIAADLIRQPPAACRQAERASHESESYDS